MDGWDGWDGWMEYQKCPSNFFILCEYIGNIYLLIYIYIYSKIVTNFVMGSKIYVKLESLNFIFKPLMGKCDFEK